MPLFPFPLSRGAPVRSPWPPPAKICAGRGCRSTRASRRCATATRRARVCTQAVIPFRGLEKRRLRKRVATANCARWFITLEHERRSRPPERGAGI